jgi:hypothetical protein
LDAIELMDAIGSMDTIESLDAIELMDAIGSMDTIESHPNAEAKRRSIRKVHTEEKDNVRT